jgi:hypothetical protein
VLKWKTSRTNAARAAALGFVIACAALITPTSAAAQLATQSAYPVVTASCDSSGGYWNCDVSYTGGTAPVSLRYYYNGTQVFDTYGRCTIHRYFYFRVDLRDAEGRTASDSKHVYCLGYE